MHPLSMPTNMQFNLDKVYHNRHSAFALSISLSTFAFHLLSVVAQFDVIDIHFE